MKLSDILANYRKEMLITLDELSEKSSLSRSYLSKIQNGGLDDQSISLATLIKLARGLNIKVKDILELMDVSESTPSTNIPLNVYLRKSHAISDDNDIKMIEKLIRHLKD